MVSQKISLILTAIALVIGIPSSILALNEFGFISLGEAGVLKTIIPEYQPANPYLYVDEEFGFQITLTDIEDWKIDDSKYWYSELSWKIYRNSDGIEKFKILPNVREKIITINPLNPKHRYSEIEIYAFEPNENDREKNIKNIVTTLNGIGITQIESELEGSKSGLWYVEDNCSKWDEYNCKLIGWMDLHKSENTLYITHFWKKYDSDESSMFELEDEYGFIMNSFRPF